MHVRPVWQSELAPHAMPDDARVLVQLFEELEEPLQYGDSVQHVELVEQVLPVQLVIALH